MTRGGSITTRAKATIGVLCAVLLGGCSRQGFEKTTPHFELSTTTLVFEANVGKVASPQMVSLSEAHDLSQPWYASADRRWVSISPARGTGASEILVSVSTQGIVPGNHQSEVTFRPDGGGTGSEFATLIVELELRDPGWTVLGGPSSGDIRRLAVHPDDSDRILAGGGEGVIYLSTDSGASFTGISFGNADPITDIVLLPSGRAYLSTQPGSTAAIFRSDDSGLTWNPTGLRNVGIDSLAARSDDLLLADGAALYRSSDGGTTFDQLTPPTDIRFVTLDPSNPDGFLIGGTNGTLFSTDGSAFLALPTGQDLDLYGFTASPAGIWYVNIESPDTNRPYEILVSDDRGATWNPATRTGLPGIEYLREIRLHASGDDLWVLFDDAFLSRNNAELFVAVSLAFNPLSRGSWYTDAADHADGVLLAHQSNGILQHVPGTGVTQLGLRANVIRDLTWVPTTRELFGIADPGGVFRMDTSGVVTALGGTGLAATRYRALSLDPRNPHRLLVGSPDAHTGLYRSEDGGLSWTVSAPGLDTSGTVYRIARAPDNPDVLWLACGYNDLFVSSDNGRSFSRAYDGFVFQVVALSSTEALFDAEGISRHDRAADRVEQVLEVAAPSVLARTLDGSIWFGAHYPMQRSTDGGHTFQEVGLGARSPTCVEVDPNNPTHIYVGFSEGLFESRDNGATWREAGAPFPVTSLALDPETGSVYIGTNGGGIYQYAPSP